MLGSGNVQFNLGFLPRAGSLSTFLSPPLAASRILRDVTLPNSLNLNDNNDRNRRRKSARMVHDIGDVDAHIRSMVRWTQKQQRKVKKKKVAKSGTVSGCHCERKCAPLANSLNHSISDSVDEFNPRTITHVCSPVNSLCV